MVKFHHTIALLSSGNWILIWTMQLIQFFLKRKDNKLYFAHATETATEWRLTVCSIYKKVYSCALLERKSRKFFCLFLSLGQDVKCLLFWMLTEWRQTGGMAPAASPAPAEVSPYQIFSLCVNFEFSFLHKLELEDIDILQRTNATLREDKIIIKLLYIFDCEASKWDYWLFVFCKIPLLRNILHVDHPEASLYSYHYFKAISASSIT